MNRSLPHHHLGNPLFKCWRTLVLFALVLSFSTAARAQCNLNTAWTYTTHGDTVFVTCADTNTVNHHFWSFNGTFGTANSLTYTYVFPQPGTYTVCLHEYTPGTNCIDSLCHQVTVSPNTPCNLNTAWTYTIHGDTIYTTTSDTNTVNHHFWTFGSYTYPNNSVTGVYVATQPGTYRVCLHEYTPGTNCIDSFCQYLTIQQGTSPCNLNTAWTYTTHGDTVYVTASDTNTLNHHYWTFGSYTSTANSLTASYVFSQAGSYHVCLHEYTPGSNCVDSSCQTVSVTATAPCTLTANWQSYTHGDTVYFFASNANSAAHYFWNFGDGSPITSGSQVTHIYPNAGTYHVCLYDYIPNTTCADSLCQNVSVTAITCHLNMAWTYTLHGDTIYVAAADTSTVNHHYWSFGSHTSTANSTTASYVFTGPGIYHVCLHEYTPGTNCVDSSCNSITIVAPCSLSASWIFSNHLNDTVHFYGVDTNSTAHRYWTYGDGTGTTTNIINPVHVYAQPGTYHVCMHIYIPGTTCIDSFCSTITVGTPCNINAAWQAVIHGDSAHFYPISTGANVNYSWNYGDGHTGTGTNPTHVYAQAGTYHVCLYAYSGTNCIDSFCNTITIASGCHVSAAWTYTLHGDTIFVQSTDTSSANHHYWSFGAGSTGVNATSVTHVFTGPGVYHICLYVYTLGTGCTDSSCNTITITNPCNVHAIWQSYTSGDTAHFFASGNTGTVYYNWHYGDGQTGTGNNPTHVYAQAGTYHVCLYAYSGTNCLDSFCNTVTVGSGCHVSAAWTYTIHGDTVILHSTDTSTANNHYWTFGTGSSYASGTTVTHVYPNYGTYHICLHVYTPGTTCSDSSCNTITISSPCNVSAAWQSYTHGDTVHFYAGNNPGTSSLDWNFGDGNFGFGTNPTHVYTQAGTYHVCLYAYTGSNCIDSFCNTVTVGNGCHVSAAWTYTIHGDTVFLHSTDTSSANNHYWKFGTPNYTSGTSVTHVYTGPGTYHICLYVYTPGTTCTDSSCNTITISTTCNVTAAWQSYNVGDTTHFFASGNTAGVSYSWNFGDGHTGTGANPLHTYAQAGTYHVCLYAYNGNCVDSFCNTVTVAGGCHVSAAWSYTISGDTIFLTSADTLSANHHYWIFDGNTSTYVSGTTATHVYTGPGIHHICLYVYTPGTTCADSSCNNITIANTCQANAAWSSYDHGDTAFFSAADTSSAVYLDWNFGDGHYGFGQYPTHVYAQPGTYHVCLYAYTGTNCIDSFCNTVTVGSGCHVSAAWTYTISGDTIYLHSTDTASANHHVWIFDGNTSTFVNATSVTHVYTGPGIHHICLYVYTPGTNCIDSSCNTITISNTCNVSAVWQSYDHGDTVHFFAGGNTGTVYYNWNYGDGHTGTGANPVHVYANAGTYHVCLYAYTGSNCIDSFCNTVTIGGGCHLNSSWNYTTFSDTFYFMSPDTNSAAHHYWNFGDGTTASGVTVSHIYSAPGTYHVCYYVYIPGTTCVDSACNDITINSPCAITAAWNFVHAGGDTFYFYGAFQDSSANYVWLYGDGTSSTGAYSIHQYPVPGTYDVCLHVLIPGTPCADSVCIQINVGATCAVTAEWASITRANDSIQFYALDPDTNAVHTWHFGDGTTGSGSYAAHTYPTAGSYHVCLYVYIPGTTCSDSICHDVNSALGINDIAGTYPTISLRPNPFSQYTVMNIDGPASTYEVRVYDLVGQQVRTIVGVNNSITIERGSLSSGMYMYEVMAGNVVIGKGKMTIE